MIIRAIALSIIIKWILFLLVVLLTLFQDIGDNPEKAIVKVAEGNIWDMKQTMYMTIYTHVPKNMKKKLYFEIQSISYEDW